MKRILFIVHRIPFPPNKGDKIRSFNELKYLSQQHSVDLLCLVDEPEDHKYFSELEKLCDRVAAFSLNPHSAKIRGALALLTGGALSSRYFYLQEMQSRFDDWVQTKSYDAILCFSSSMAEYIFESRVLSKLKVMGKPQLIMDFCDVDSAKWRQYSVDSKFPLSWVYNLEFKRLMEYEQRVQNHFDKTVLVSCREAEYFRTHYQNCSSLSVILNGVDHDYFSPTKINRGPKSFLINEGPKIVFTGAMDYPVNIKGVSWFVREIWPYLQNQFPAIHLYIVGSNPSKEIRDMGVVDNITVTGFVPDIREYYALADICIAPLHQGRGLQNKVLEAMSMATPVVATNRANAGVQGVPGEHLMIADTSEDYVDAISWLLRNSEDAEKMGRAARSFVVSRFDWQSNMSAFEELLVNPEM